jgi:hypothetical protein
MDGLDLVSTAERNADRSVCILAEKFNAAQSMWELQEQQELLTD